MRRIALAPLLVATGCNWIYGLDHTVALDAAPPAEVLPPGPRTKLVWAIATTDGMPAPPMLDAMVIYKPIGSETLHSDLPVIKVGDSEGLMDAPYDLADGSFEIPYRLRESPHRIVYTLPGETVQHEVQWSLTGATLTIPRTTRFDAPATPSNAGYRITPMGTVPVLNAPVIYTTGVFTYASDRGDATDDFEQNGSEITFRFAKYQNPLTAPSGLPEKAKGDWVLVGDFGARGNGQSSLTGYALTQIDLSANTMGEPDVQPTWVGGMANERTMSTALCTPPAVDCMPLANPAQLEARLNTALGGLGGNLGRALAYGVSPSTELPGFVPGIAPSFVPRPLLLPFLTSTDLNSNLKLVDPSGLLGLERVLFAGMTSSRLVGAVTLTSAVQSVTNVFAGTLTFPAPLVTNVRLGGTSLGPEVTDAVPIAASSSPIKLTFNPEASFTADDFVVTLYQLAGPTLMPVRVYHVVQPEVNVDGMLLTAGHQYVFGITARSGYGGAKQGDYSKAQYPFGASTTFPRTFVVQ